MKIIFLDFDGVLNSCERRYHDDPLDKTMIQNVNSVIQTTGAKVVVSSDWRRRNSLSSLQKDLNSFGFVGDLIDKTSEIFSRNCDLESERQQEIFKWLDSNPQVTQWIAIDDMDLPLDSANFVHTNPAIGFTVKNAKSAIKKLS